MKHYLVFLLCCVLVKSYSIEQRGWSASLSEKEKTNEDEPQENVLDSLNRCPDDDDLSSNTTIACHGVKIVRRVMSQLLDQGGKRNFQLSDGVEFVKVEDGSRNLGDDSSVFGKIQGFLSNHELRVKLQDFLPNTEDLGRAFNGSLQQIAEGRGKNKGGGGLLAMGLMMKGMMAALGMGGLGLLAMKALMVSALALMLSAIVAVKKLASKDDGGGHYVSVVPVHHGGGGGGHDGHYRRKREEPDNIAYRAHVPRH